MWHFLAVLVVSSLLIVGGCGPESIDDPGGGPSEIRLAVLSPALADTVHALGAGELIVGRQQFDRVTRSEIPVVGDLSGIDYETMIRVRPTHIVAQRTAAGLPLRLIELAQERNWEIVELPLLRLEDIVESVGAMARLVGSEPEVSRILTDRLELGLAGGLSLGRTVVVVSATPLAVIGPGAFHAQIVERLGATVVPDSGPAYLPLDAETFASLQPETIVLLMPGADAGMRGIDLLGVAGQLPIPAVEYGRILVVRDDRCMLPSVSILGMIDQIREQATELVPLEH